MHQRPSRSIQLDDDMRFQRRSWAVERVGWTVMGVAIVAAVLGIVLRRAVERNYAG